MPATETPGVTPGISGNRRDPSFIRIIKDLRDDAVTLVRQEVALAKREMASKAASLGRNAAFLGAGALVGLFGAFFVLLALNNLLFAGLAKIGFTTVVSNWLAPALLGLAILIAAMGLVLKALKSMRKASAVPEKTMQTLHEDADWIKGRIR